MNAKEARIKSLQITGEKERMQYNQIKTLISKNVNLGKLKCCINFNILNSVKCVLENEGFNVIYNHGVRNDNETTISW